jgi:hypothetical protein
MIVELAGCSGAGKSSLLPELIRAFRAADVPAAAAPDALLRGFPSPVVRQPTLQNVLLDFAGAWGRITHPGNHLDFTRFARAVLLRRSDPIARRLNAYRGMLRALGVYDALSRHSGEPGIVFVDEGTVNSAHAVLVDVTQAPEAGDIDRFCRLVPKPDLLLHVSAPLEVVLARTAVRRDPPLPRRSRSHRERFIRHAHATFEQIVSHEAFSQNTVRICCDDNAVDQYRIRATELAAELA